MTRNRFDVWQLLAHSRASGMQEQGTRRLPQTRSVLVPTTLAARETPALVQAMKLARRCGLSATVLRVTPAEVREQHPHGFDAFDRLFTAAWQIRGTSPQRDSWKSPATLRAETKAFVSRYVPSVVCDLADVRYECRRGALAAEIIRYAERADVEMVVLPSPLSIWRLPMLPLNTRRVLRRVSKPVIVVQPEERNKSVLPQSGPALACS